MMNLNEWKMIMSADELKGMTANEIAETLDDGMILHINGKRFKYEIDTWTGADSLIAID